jgi:NAD-dependent DNA ligase
VEHVKEATLAKLYDAGFTSVEHLLRAAPADLARAPGVGDAVAAKFVESLEAGVAKADVAALMAATNAFGPGVGRQRLAAVAAAIPRFWKLDSRALMDAVLRLPGFQAATAGKIVDGAPRFVERMRELGLAIPDAAAARRDKVVFTGFRDKALEADAVLAGYEVVGAVTSNTHALVAKDPDADSAKTAKARALGVAVVSAKAFAAKIKRRLTPSPPKI